VAYGNGDIKLPAIPRDTNKIHIRYAPHFKAGVEPSPTIGEGHPYTAQTLANFLGWSGTLRECPGALLYG
jgi:hypothetical protein